MFLSPKFLKINPLAKADDAILIDNTMMSLQEQDMFLNNLITKYL